MNRGPRAQSRVIVSPSGNSMQPATHGVTGAFLGLAARPPPIPPGWRPRSLLQDGTFVDTNNSEEADA